MEQTAKEKNLRDHLYVSILCGGGGKRLWPRSRKQNPKQFLDLLGNKSVFTQTFERAKKMTTPDKVFLATNYRYVADVLSQAKDLFLRNIIAEPQAKNTALAMGLAAVQIAHQDPEAVIINLTSDHVVAPEEVFRQDLTRAAQLAQTTGQIVTIGIKPTYPHIGFGYIKVGQPEKGLAKELVYKVSQFTEKPNLATAKKFLKSGHYFWNAGLYIWQAKTVLAAIKQHAPKLSRLLEKVSLAIGTPKEAIVLSQVYQAADDISIDYAVSEKSDNLLLVPARFSWDDIGDWEVVYRRSKKDQEGNAVIRSGEKGSLVTYEAQNNLVHLHESLIALVGVQDLAIVDTGDVLLITSLNHAEKVKQIVLKLKEEGRVDHL